MSKRHYVQNEQLKVEHLEEKRSPAPAPGLGLPGGPGPTPATGPAPTSAPAPSPAYGMPVSSTAPDVELHPQQSTDASRAARIHDLHRLRRTDDVVFRTPPTPLSLGLIPNARACEAHVPATTSHRRTASHGRRFSSSHSNHGLQILIPHSHHNTWAANPVVSAFEGTARAAAVPTSRFRTARELLATKGDRTSGSSATGRTPWGESPTGWIRLGCWD